MNNKGQRRGFFLRLASDFRGRPFVLSSRGRDVAEPDPRSAAAGRAPCGDFGAIPLFPVVKPRMQTQGASLGESYTPGWAELHSLTRPVSA